MNTTSTFKHIYTATLELANTTLNPIIIPGGSSFNNVLISGNVTGSVVNGTIQGGFAHASLINEIEVPIIDMYGMTSDGESFYIHQEGVGSTSEQVSRVVLEIGDGRYKGLSNGFILASSRMASQFVVVTEGYLVQNILP